MRKPGLIIEAAGGYFDPGRFARGPEIELDGPPRIDSFTRWRAQATTADPNLT